MHQDTWNFASRVLPASVCKHCRKAGSSYMSVHCSMMRPGCLPTCDCTAVTVLCRAYCSVFHTFLAPTCKPMIPFAHCQDEITFFQQKFRFNQEAYKYTSYLLNNHKASFADCINLCVAVSKPVISRGAPFCSAAWHMCMPKYHTTC